ncbi:DNA repair protein RadA [bacterium SCSIO 12741]|nr:DNA repair protein RadA [bacterium SCSIO 12741]
MAKSKSIFYCQNCGASSPKWMGKCTSCGEWNTYVEEVVSKPTAKQLPGDQQRQPELLVDVQVDSQPRIEVGIHELHRLLGGGLVPGSLTLVGGEPGIGKSTLLLQLANELKGQVLYVSGEESAAQIKLRADRLPQANPNCYVLAETQLIKILNHAEKIKPDLLIIDSIQTLHSDDLDSAPGSISQIRTCTSDLLRYAKSTGVPVFLIGHITKDGALAGPKVLEHMVDTVLQFEGDRNHVYRILRAVKNRFGSTNELAIFQMDQSGLREVSNPSEILISNRDAHLSGVAIAASIEGVRPLLIETQALVSSAVYGTPQRSSTGFDLRRLSMLLAVLEKRCGFRLGAKDVFLNMAGGIKVDDPATDLAVVSAILSSNEDFPIDPGTCFAAEVGLSGEIRPVNRVEQRIREAQKIGFERIIVSSYSVKGLDLKQFDIQVIAVRKIEEVFNELFG